MAATMTSTLSVVQQTSSILLPAPAADLSRVVRFDSECVLIPEPSKRPKPTKTYSLPLWKKKSSDTEAGPDGSSSRAPLSPEETHVVFKVPIPRFISRSPSRGRGTSSSPPAPKPLSPCLVHKPSSPSSPTMPKAIRRTSLPLTTCSIPKHDALTVPLRPCCDACVTITEESLKEGDDWQEKFSRGARRRRSASLDNSDNFGLDVARSGSIHHSAGFTAQMDLSPGSRYRPSTFSLTVDEVDKRRKSQEFTEEDVMRFRSGSPRSSPVLYSPNGPYATTYPLTRGEKDASTSSSSSSITTSSELEVPPRRLKSSPIQEEDEDQLFPLPSPRRSPNNSPSPSVTPSASPSPNASTSCLSPAAAAAGVRSGSDDVLIKSLSRKIADAGLQSSALPDAPALDHVRLSPSPSATTTTKPQLIVNTATPAHMRTTSVTVNNGPFPAEPAPSSSPVQSRGRALPNPPKFPRSPTMSPPPKTRRPSFSLPGIKDAIKGASVDMLKGVSSMGGGGVAGL